VEIIELSRYADLANNIANDVIGFMLEDGSNKIYVTGDTVWHDGVAEVARRFDANVVLLFAGSAQTRGPFYLARTARWHFRLLLKATWANSRPGQVR
jgi:hypothetical protein